MLYTLRTTMSPTSLPCIPGNGPILHMRALL